MTSRFEGALRPPLRRSTIATVFLGLLLTACQPEVQFADWSLSVPDGTPVREYAGVPLEEREARIELVEDLVIGANDDPRLRFYNAREAVSDASGRIFVMDGGNHRIQVFGPDGSFLMTLGREGQGPGEYVRLANIAIADNHVVTRGAGNRRFTVWSTDGELLGEFPEGPGSNRQPVGLDDGTIVMLAGYRADEDAPIPVVSRYRLVHLSEELAELAEIFRFPPYEQLAVYRGDFQTSLSMTSVPLPSSSAAFAVSRDGRVYAAMTDEHQVHALDATGARVWSLRVAWQPHPITDAEIDEAVATIRERSRWADLSRSEIEWPSRRPAIERLAVDGHGLLYVYLHPLDENAEDRAVDVFSPEGDLLFSGWIPATRWLFARDDYVLAQRTNELTGEENIVRYRLVTPF